MSITQNAFFTKTLILFKIENLLQIFGSYFKHFCRFLEVILSKNADFRKLFEPKMQIFRR